MKNVLCDFKKLIEYSASSVTVVSSNLCVEPLPRTKIYTFLLSIWTNELLSTPKITTFLPQSKFGTAKSERESNPIPYLELEYLSGSIFLVNVTTPNKQHFRAKSAFKYCGHLSNS